MWPRPSPQWTAARRAGAAAVFPVLLLRLARGRLFCFQKLRYITAVGVWGRDGRMRKELWLVSSEAQASVLLAAPVPLESCSPHCVPNSPGGPAPHCVSDSPGGPTHSGLPSVVMLRAGATGST